MNTIFGTWKILWSLRHDKLPLKECLFPVWDLSHPIWFWGNTELLALYFGPKKKIQDLSNCWRKTIPMSVVILFFFFSKSAMLKCNQLMVAEYTGWRFHQEHLCSVTQHNTEIKIEYVLIFNPKAPLKYKKHNKT